MDVLIKRIEDLNFQRPYDRETHKKIYSYINENVLSVADQDECPPLQILIYAVENIISPDLIRLQIPHLLHLLAHIECIRRRAVKQASRALSWNDYFSDSDERRAVLLTEQERKFMEQISDESEQAGDRKLYATVIFRLCQLHIHSLWRDDTEDQLQDYMAQYFPSFTNQQPNRLFYLDLSQDEQRQLRDVGKTCAKFLRDASEWETRLEQAWVAKGFSIDDLYGIEEFLQERSAKFEEEFPEPVNAELLCEYVERYAKHTVGRMVQDFESIFQ